jgi:hypothetical protein
MKYMKKEMVFRAFGANGTNFERMEKQNLFIFFTPPPDFETFGRLW